MAKELSHNNVSSPLVSFVIAYYDIPVEMLRECVDSIRHLSLRPSEREIIVVDDGSAYCPINELSNVCDDIIYVRQRNEGLGMARNRGLLMAQGQFIQFIDADDRLIGPPYEQCLDIVRYQQADMVMFHATNKIDEPFEPAVVNATSGSTLMRTRNIRGAAWGYLFAKKILGDLRFPPHIFHEDEAFTPQLLLRAEQVYDTPYHAYYYRPRENSITRRSDKQTIEQRLDDTQQVIMQLYHLCDKLSPADRPAMERRVAQLTMDYLYNTIVLTRSHKALNTNINFLKQQGLFPLPDRNYTKKYQWFRRLINTTWGRQVLICTIPMIGKRS